MHTYCHSGTDRQSELWTFDFRSLCQIVTEKSVCVHWSLITCIVHVYIENCVLYEKMGHSMNDDEWWMMNDVWCMCQTEYCVNSEHSFWSLFSTIVCSTWKWAYCIMLGALLLTMNYKNHVYNIIKYTMLLNPKWIINCTMIQTANAHKYPYHTLMTNGTWHIGVYMSTQKRARESCQKEEINTCLVFFFWFVSPKRSDRLISYMSACIWQFKRNAHTKLWASGFWKKQLKQPQRRMIK